MEMSAVIAPARVRTKTHRAAALLEEVAAALRPVILGIVARPHRRHHPRPAPRPPLRLPPSQPPRPAPRPPRRLAPSMEMSGAIAPARGAKTHRAAALPEEVAAALRRAILGIARKFDTTKLLGVRRDE